MRSRVEIVEPHQIEYPLRSLVTTLMLGLDLETELLTDEEIESQKEGAFRHYDGTEGELERWGVRADDVSMQIRSDRDNEAHYATWLFSRGAEAVLMDVEVPEYCDDESDGYILGVSPVMTLAAAKVELARRLQSYREEVMKHLADIASETECIFDELQAIQEIAEEAP